MSKRVLSMVLAVLMAFGVAVPALAEKVPDVLTAEKNAVSSTVEQFFVEAYGGYSKKTAFSSLAEFYQLYGEEKGNRCANCMNYYYDTGEERALEVVWRLVKDMSTDGYGFPVSYTPKTQNATPTTKTEVTEAPFPDVPTDAWYAEAVSAMKDSGIIMGCDDGLFHPEREVTMGEFYAMLLRAGTYDGANISGGNSGSHWASGILITAQQNFFWPPDLGHENDTVTRFEAVSRIVALNNNAMNKNSTYKALWNWTMERERTLGTMTYEDIPDHDAIELYFTTQARYGAERQQFAYAYNTGICKGVDDTGNFNPTGTLTRAEVAQMFSNAKFTKRYMALLGDKVDGWYDLRSTENVVH